MMISIRQMVHTDKDEEYQSNSWRMNMPPWNQTGEGEEKAVNLSGLGSTHIRAHYAGAEKEEQAGEHCQQKLEPPQPLKLIQQGRRYGLQLNKL